MSTTAPAERIIEPPPARRPASLDHQLRQHVLYRVTALQTAYLADSPRAVASLARLRRALASSPGSDTWVWEETLADVPEALLGSDTEPSDSERAIHASLTLYALHQQSRTAPMHMVDVSLGAGVRRLGIAQASEEATLRRFHALGTASSTAEALYHLRGLVTQLRGANIPLDYGRLAVDLRRLQQPVTAPGVRLQWGRDYHRRAADKSTSPEESTTTGDH